MITDELRKYASSLAMKAGASTTEVKGALEEIADRIDRKHEQAPEGYIELPVGTDGEPLRPGDEVDLGCWPGIPCVLRRVELCGGQWCLYVVQRDHEDEPGYGSAFIPWPENRGGETVRHAKPDSWERIIADAQADGVRYHNDGRPSDFDALVERCKRLAGEDA